MKTLVLRFRGPLQSWGFDSRYRIRGTHSMPTKSGVLGLLAAALGRQRTDVIADLAGLEFAVRIDQPGSLERDYQTARRPGEKSPRLSTRYYLADAVFLAAVSGDDGLIEGLAHAVGHPLYPLYLGRRNCPANHDLLVGVTDDGVEDALRAVPWQAAEWHRRKRSARVLLPLLRDARGGENGDQLNDVPLSFDQQNRQYAWRTVYEADPVVFDNSEAAEASDPFMEAVRGL